jgi:hypothetical protein
MLAKNESSKEFDLQQGLKPVVSASGMSEEIVNLWLKLHSRASLADTTTKERTGRAYLPSIASGMSMMLAISGAPHDTPVQSSQAQ